MMFPAPIQRKRLSIDCMLSATFLRPEIGTIGTIVTIQRRIHRNGGFDYDKAAPCTGNEQHSLKHSAAALPISDQTSLMP